MKKLTALLLVAMCLLVAVSAAADPKGLENGPLVKMTIYTNLKIDTSMNINGTFGERANVQLRIPEDDWKAGNGRAAGEPAWTVTRTEGPAVDLTTEPEEWNDHRGAMFQAPETITVSGLAKYDFTCAWNNQDYAAKAELNFTERTGDLPSGLALTVAPYDFERKTAGEATTVTDKTITVETGKYYILTATFADHPIEDHTFTMNDILSDPDAAEFELRPSTPIWNINQQVFKAGKAGSYTAEFSLNSNESNLYTVSTFTFKVTEAQPDPTAEPTAAPTPEPTAAPTEEPKVPVGQSGWVALANGAWAYGDADGNALIGSHEIDGVRYCFDSTGKMITGWGEVGDKWYYANSNGSLVIGWKQISSVWYYFNADGEMRTGWLNEGGSYYYFRSSGAMVTGWVEVDNQWYYMDRNGRLVSNWQQINGVWYYFKADGSMATGWTSIGGEWYYFKADGSMIANDWFRDVQSEAQSGSGQQLWYWFDKNGVMAKDWELINGKWERFSPSGLWEYTWTGN